MATTRTKGATTTPVKDPAPVDAPPDQPIPAQPAPRPKDAPRTMKDLREARTGKRASRAKAAENVLREGLRLERVPDPSILVLFGATGDLAHRKVIPALYHLWRTNLLPHEFVLLAIGRREYDDDTFRAEIRASLEQFSRVLPLDEAAWRRSAATSATTAWTSPTRPASTRLATRLDELDVECGTRGNHAFYLATQPSQFAEIVAQLGRVGLDHEKHDGGWRRVVIEKPFGHDLRLGQAAQPRGRQGLPRVAGLSHRPLPGQGDRPQPAGLPLRQRHLRAALEPALRRPRADHRGRVDRHREPRARSTRRPAPRATSSRTTSCSWSASSPWSRRRRSRRTPCATRRSRSCAPSARNRPTRRPRSCAASTARAGSPRHGRPGLPPGARRRPGVGDRDVRRRPA